jgi:type II secretory ATPase GspE/PulE/Tfp pilus assembly ATPase PilB-like protein/CheY-like chemotaxis protein
MANRPVRDDWLIPTLEELIGANALEVLRAQAPESYWEAAVRAGACSDLQLLEALSARYRMRIANLSVVSPQARELVPEALARKYRVLPIGATDTWLEIATSSPNDLDCERTLAFATGRTVRMTLGAPGRILERIDELYRPENAVEKILEGVTARYDIEAITEEADDFEMDIAGGGATKRPVIRLVDHIIAEAITSRASDIHLEPEEGGVAVRYRIDGVLREVMSLPRPAGLPLVSRIKIMAQMDIADRLRPQDGRARVSVNGSRIDLRVSTLPAAHGEKVVIRILDSRSNVLSLDKLGTGTDEAARINQLVGLREGIILVTGPTGSGKTTTLYSALRTIQARGVNIVTVEDPVEYKIPGIVQVQVNEKAGLTFASALRSILRQDPDVILVGEIRDKETATIAVQASLTGHLVLSTLHTIDAVSSVARLLDIGIESYKIAAALKGVVAQRLLRRLCPTCREPLREEVPERFHKWLGHGVELYRAVGCPECAMTGYHGRLAVMEVIVTTAEVERRIAENASGERIARAARDGGMRSLWESAIDHLRAGDTTLDEVLRVVEAPIDYGHGVDGAGPTPARGSAPVAEPASSRPSRGPGRETPVRAPALREPTPPRVAIFPDDSLELVEDGFGAGRGARGTVLLVEDEEPLRRVLRDLLERDGWTVVEAADGIAALDEVDRSGPDVVVLDLNLPRLDGFGVLEHLRARPATAHLPVIVLTANADEDSEVRVFESGANDFLSKPFRPRALSARLRSIVRS